MKFFYILAVGWLIIIFIGDSESDVHEYVREATFVLIALLAFAVAAISQRIDRAVKQIKEPDFDVAAANRKDWLEVGQLFFAVLMLFVVGTAVQGAIRCASSGSEFSVACVWDGIWEQIDEDLN
jgi:hypothetical protein